MNYMELIGKKLRQATEEEKLLVLNFINNVIPERGREDKKED